MTNEELAELEILLAQADGAATDLVDRYCCELALRNAIPSLIATAREAEALRAENARLTKQRDFLGERLADLALEMGRLRAALEQGEAAILRAERNEP